MKDFLSNDFANQSLAQAIEEMKSIQGNDFSIDNINLAELERRTGISRQRLRTLKANGFKLAPHGRTGQSNQITVLSLLSVSLLLLRRAAGTDSLLNPAKPFRWTGDSLKSSIPLDRNSMLPVLPWYVITVVNAMWNSFPMPDRKICLSECCKRLHSWAFQDMF